MAVTSDMFSWEDGCGCCCISTVQGNGGINPKTKHLEIKSERTGKIEEFYLYSNDYGKEELESFTYKPVSKNLDRKDITIVLFND